MLGTWYRGIRLITLHAVKEVVQISFYLIALNFRFLFDLSDDWLCDFSIHSVGLLFVELLLRSFGSSLYIKCHQRIFFGCHRILVKSTTILNGQFKQPIGISNFLKDHVLENIPIAEYLKVLGLQELMILLAVISFSEIKYLIPHV